MSQIVHKWKKVLSGCMHKSSHKYSETDNDMLDPILSNDEFKYENEIPDLTISDQTKFPIYNDYDNLQHPCLVKNNNLKDSTNHMKNKPTKKPFFRTNFSSSKINDENNNEKAFSNQKFKYSELYDEKIFDIANTKKPENNENEILYSEIPDQENYLITESNPLIFSKNHIESEPPIKRLALSQNKTCLFDNQNNDANKNDSKSLTDIRKLDSFISQQDGFHWYLNLLNETIRKCIQSDTNLNEISRSKRLSIATAHLLYSRNFYEMRISSSAQLKTKLDKVHPCLIALACLLESEAIRIEESHLCVCDSYIYLFSTRLKYCAWKSKLFILLKKPKRSSFDRLNLIEDLTNCHRLIQDK